jgi:hypothetical protein
MASETKQMRISLQLVLLSAVFSMPAFTFAQADQPGSESNLKSNENSSVPQNYQGCLSRSNRNTVLVDGSGKSYDLVSGSVSLDSYVGRRVQVRASDINAGDPSSGERSAAAGELKGSVRTLDVSQISKIADQCSAPGK